MVIEDMALLQLRAPPSNLNEAVWIMDGAGRLQYANPAFERLTGASEPGSDWQAVLAAPEGALSPADGGAAAAAVARVREGMAAGQAVRVEMLCRGGGGGTFWGNLSVTPILDACGAARRWVGICEDITAHRASASTLQLAGAALACTAEAVVITDPNQPDSPIIYVNSAFEALTGYSRAEVVGRNCRLLQGPDTDPAVLADLAAALEEGRPAVVEVLNYKKGGTPFWNKVSVTPIRAPPDAGGGGGPGRVTHYVAVHADVSERKAAEAASELREQALRNLSEGIVVVDATLPDMPIQYANDAFLVRRLPAASCQFCFLWTAIS